MSTTPTPAPTAPTPPVEEVLTENQVAVLHIASKLYGTTSVNSLDDAYQSAKNLVLIMQNDPDEAWKTFFAAG